jgi:hypothetical protein
MRSVHGKTKAIYILKRVFKFCKVTLRTKIVSRRHSVVVTRPIGDFSFESLLCLCLLSEGNIRDLNHYSLSNSDQIRVGQFHIAFPIAQFDNRNLSFILLFFGVFRAKQEQCLKRNM